MLGSSALLIAIVLWFDNAQGGLTGNGVFKGLELRPWVTDPAIAPLYPSNYLYYPLYGALCRLLDLLGVFAGDPRRQITILNAVSCSLCLAVVYLLIRSLTGDRLIALLAAMFHLASSFVMFLAIVNEDILPSYTVLLAAMALGSVWFARPTAARVAAVAVLFSLAWLMEWRLMFPTLPALLAALWLCEPRPARRLGWIALFLAGMVLTACVAALAWQGHEDSVGPIDLLWTGKAVRSVWAGFTWPKVGYLWDGMVAYLLGAGVAARSRHPGLGHLALHLDRLDGGGRGRGAAPCCGAPGATRAPGRCSPSSASPSWPVASSTSIRSRRTRRCRSTSWPGSRSPGRWCWWRRGGAGGARGLAALAGLTVALFAYNVWSLAPLRGLDSAWQRAIGRLEQESDPARTVWLMHDFDWAMVYASLHWGSAEPGTDSLGPAPQAKPKFKWIGFTGQVLRHPDWSDERQVADLRRQIDRALALGYDVLVVRLWDMNLAQLETATGMVASSTRLDALRQLLHDDYVATLAFTDPTAGAVHRLQRRPGR